MTWERTAERYLAAFEKAPARASAQGDRAAGRKRQPCPTPRRRRRCDWAIFCRCATTRGFSSTRSTRCPIVRTAIASTTMPVHCSWLARSTLQMSSDLPEALTARLAAFVQHAWNPATKRFRNFMSFDRRWLEDIGSEDSHGRALWALGECARSDASPSRRRWAACLFAEALPTVERFHSPRAWAFTLLGLDAYCVRGSRRFRGAAELRRSASATN